MCGLTVSNFGAAEDRNCDERLFIETLILLLAWINEPLIDQNTSCHVNFKQYSSYKASLSDMY